MREKWSWLQSGKWTSGKIFYGALAVFLAVMMGGGMTEKSLTSAVEPEISDVSAAEASPVPISETNPTVDRIQRTMKTLAESTAENPAQVRVLFYGQSIVAQNWTEAVINHLKTAYPTVQFTFRNAAIGGYTSPSLSRTAEGDLYPWYPDLLFFHVYGPIEQYEEIVQKTRERTTAEIILWTSHLSEKENPRAMLDERDQRSKDILAVAERNRCMVIDLNQKWSRMLIENGWEPKHLLADVIHLNPEGCQRYADFIIEELIRLDGTAGQPDISGTIREIPICDDSVRRGDNGEITLNFEGNRVVAVSDGSGNPGAEADVFLDGQPMEPMPELWSVTRPSEGPVWMPAINAVGHETAPIAEDWTLRALEGSAPDGSLIRFAVTGSVTGPDGEGNSAERFVSNSGRVVIEPADFAAVGQFAYFKEPLPKDFTVTWSSYPLFTSPYTASARGTRTLLVQNCVNGPHTLTLHPRSGESIGITSLIIHAPAPFPPRPRLTEGTE